MTAAYHGKADKHGKSDQQFLDEVYSFSMNDYLLALSKGYTLGDSEKRTLADRLAAYTGIPADYFLSHGLAIAKQDFNRQLLAGKLLNANDTRIATSPAPTARKSSRGAEAADRRPAGFLSPGLQRLHAPRARGEPAKPRLSCHGAGIV